jgi:hypothetical protein
MQSMRQDRSIPTNQIRVGDLKERHVITAQCWKCKHVATIPPARIRRGRPTDMLLIDVSFRMKCTQCGVRGAQTLSVYLLPNHA